MSPKEFVSQEPSDNGSTHDKKLSARYWNIAGGIIGFWAALIPYAYEYIMWIAILFPFAVLYFVWKGMAIVSLDDIRGRSNLHLALFFPAIGVLAGSGYYQYYFEKWYTALWTGLIAIPLAVIVLKIIYRYRRDSKAKTIFTSLVVFIVTGCYLFGIFTFVNCYYDHSEPVTAHTSILSKKIHRSRGGKSYYLLLKGWKANMEDIEVSVNNPDFDNLEAGYTLEILQYRGLLGKEWFTFKEFQRPVQPSIAPDTTSEPGEIDTINVIQKGDSVFIEE